MLSTFLFCPKREENVHIERLDRSIAYTQAALIYAAVHDSGEVYEYEWRMGSYSNKASEGDLGSGSADNAP